MERKTGINIVIEREKVNGKTVFLASSPDINVFAEGDTIDEVTNKFIQGAKTHLEVFPEDRILLLKGAGQEYEMPLITKVFL